MSESPSKITNNPWALCRCIDDDAKAWWGRAAAFKILGFIVGTGAIVFAWPSKPIPFILAALSLVAEVCSHRSDEAKGMAQSLRRKLDLNDSMAWEVPKTELSDLLVKCSAVVKRKASQLSNEPTYFTSHKAPGAQRALENISESSWWSKHLAEKMGFTCLLALIAATLIALATLIFTIHSAAGPTLPDTLSAVARVVTALLMLTLSIGLLKLTTSYYSFSKKAGRTEEAERLLKAGKKISTIDALKVIAEYHIARAGAPIIPTWIWKMHRAELNAIWANLRRTED
jgi:multisubunit Na+/H+ antiporter MnhF subunit